jgi:hypothetical protein
MDDILKTYALYGGKVKCAKNSPRYSSNESFGFRNSTWRLEQSRAGNAGCVALWMPGSVKRWAQGVCELRRYSQPFELKTLRMTKQDCGAGCEAEDTGNRLLG